MEKIAEIEAEIARLKPEHRQVVELLRGGYASISVAQQLRLSKSTVRGWKRKFAHLIETQNATIETIETHTVSKTVRSKRETQNAETIETENETIAPVLEVAETVVANTAIAETQNATGRMGVLKLFQYVVVISALIPIFIFQVNMTNEAFFNIGQIVGANVVMSFSLVAAFGFEMVGMATVFIAKTDAWGEQNVTPVVAFGLLSACFNAYDLLRFANGFANFTVGAIISIATPVLLWIISGLLFKLTNE